MIIDEDNDELRVLVRALKLYRAHVETQHDLLHSYRLSDDAVSALNNELDVIDTIIARTQR